MADAAAPLNDPAYEPQHPPTDGRIPDVIAKWGPRSQVRWFNRFRETINEQRKHLTRAQLDARPLHVDRYYCESEHHLGPCCYSCYEEANDYGAGVRCDGWCCCKDSRMGQRG